MVGTDKVTQTEEKSLVMPNRTNLSSEKISHFGPIWQYIILKNKFVQPYIPFKMTKDGLRTKTKYDRQQGKKTI